MSSNENAAKAHLTKPKRMTWARRLNNEDFDFWPQARVDQWLAKAPTEYDEPRLEYQKDGRPEVLYGRAIPNGEGLRYQEEKWGWNESLESGRSYLVGKEVPMPEFLKHHRSALTDWQKAAFAWAKANPFYKVHFVCPAITGRFTPAANS